MAEPRDLTEQARRELYDFIVLPLDADAEAWKPLTAAAKAWMETAAYDAAGREDRLREVATAAGFRVKFITRDQLLPKFSH